MVGKYINFVQSAIFIQNTFIFIPWLHYWITMIKLTRADSSTNCLPSFCVRERESDVRKVNHIHCSSWLNAATTQQHPFLDVVTLQLPVSCRLEMEYEAHLQLGRKSQRWPLMSWAWSEFLFAPLSQRRIIWTLQLIANDNIGWRWAQGGRGMQGRVDWWHSVSCVLTNNSRWVRAGGRHRGEGNLHIQQGEFSITANQLYI